MGVVILPATNITMQSIANLSANSKLKASSAFAGNTDFSISELNAEGCVNVNADPQGKNFGGEATREGFRTLQSNNTIAHRFLIITGDNCQVNVSYPTAAKGTLWKTGSSPTYNRQYITAAETAAGYKLYLRGIKYTSFSNIVISTSNFAYGYSAGPWVWYNEAGNYQTALSPAATKTFYVSSYTGTNYAWLKQSAAN